MASYLLHVPLRKQAKANILTLPKELAAVSVVAVPTSSSAVS